MYELDLSADDLIRAVLGLSRLKNVCILDSCGVGHLGSHLMIAGVTPVEVIEIRGVDPNETLRRFDKCLSGHRAAIFSISYDFGAKLQLLSTPKKYPVNGFEPDIFVALFDSLVVHDYHAEKTFLTGFPAKCDELRHSVDLKSKPRDDFHKVSRPESNFLREDYIEAVELIKEHIRDGETYQTNLTQQFHTFLPKAVDPEAVFYRIRRDHPAPFAAFLKRLDSTVVSASPERFFRINGRSITASPIKGTRPRGLTSLDDLTLRSELLSSEKDRAENIMIVDLLRNDLGRVCEFGSIEVQRLCELEEHPTLFHLVSTIKGMLRSDATLPEVLRALFPCGSITGAPKIRTMQIIDEIEPTPRGLSMGAIGYYIPESGFPDLASGFDLNVAIRTMIFQGNKAVFNTGGGITIDSDPEAEYEESMLKAKALFSALGNKT